ncbi:hypothetical protein [Rhizobium grahamii]|uniref:hypothetical protein n=1 Tax=Rhizobium grahamii TaxID=1120045 RepID=UPI0032B2DCF0
MSITATIFRSRDIDGGAHHRAFGLVAIVLAMAVFYVDTYTDIEGAIAVLYVVTMLLAAQATTRIGLIGLASVCAALTLISYGMTHGDDADLQSTVRLVVALAALGVTTVLLLKTEAARLTLLSANSALKESEARYRSIFDRTRVALWERDYSKLRSYLMDVRAQGITDLKAYGRTNPAMVDYCVGLIRVVAANEAAREMLGRDPWVSGL